MLKCKACEFRSAGSYRMLSHVIAEAANEIETRADPSPHVDVYSEHDVMRSLATTDCD